MSKLIKRTKQRALLSHIHEPYKRTHIRVHVRKVHAKIYVLNRLLKFSFTILDRCCFLVKILYSQKQNNSIFFEFPKLKFSI